MIHLSDTTIEQINKLMTNTYDIGLRIEVISGGCSGYQYKFSKVLHADECDDDIVIERGYAKLFIDSASAAKIEGSTIDYVIELMSQKFVVSNPDSQCCGCGESFS